MSVLGIATNPVQKPRLPRGAWMLLAANLLLEVVRLVVR